MVSRVMLSPASAKARAAQGRVAGLQLSGPPTYGSRRKDSKTVAFGIRVGSHGRVKS